MQEFIKKRFQSKKKEPANTDEVPRVKLWQNTFKKLSR